MRLALLLLLAVQLTLPATARADSPPPRVVYYARHQGDDPHAPYMRTLLTLAAAKAGVQLDFQPTRTSMNQGRAIHEIRDRTGKVDLLWTMTSVAREQELLPIRIPLFKGLIGWRIPLVRQSQAKLFEHRDKADLATLVAGQMLDWPDTDILRANGFKVASAAQYESLFAMLSRGRIDYFPRAVIEVWQELADHPDLGITAEESTVLFYPTALYFFVNRQERELAAHIERGLEAAIRDGSFDQIFMAFNQEAISRARLEHRRIIALSNPLLPPETPLKRNELWYLPPGVTRLPGADAR